MSSGKNTRVWIIVGVAVVVVAAILVGAYIGRTKKSIASTAAKAGNANLITIKTYTRKDCTSTPILVADVKGFFAEQGLKLEQTGELKDALILPSVLNGNNDFAEAHPNRLASFVAQGAQVKAVAQSIVEPPTTVDPKYRHMWYFVSPKSGIKTWDDLKTYKSGQKITMNGTVPSCTTFIPSVIFDKYGLGRGRLQFVTFDTNQEALQAVQLGNLDIAEVHPPFYKLGVDSGLVKIGDSSDSEIGPAAGIYLYYFTDSFIGQHSDVVQKFVNAIAKAQVWANANPEEAAKITSEGIGVDVNAVHYYSDNTVIPDDGVQLWIDDLVTAGSLKKDQVKLADILTHQFEVK